MKKKWHLLAYYELACNFQSLYGCFFNASMLCILAILYDEIDVYCVNGLKCIVQIIIQYGYQRIFGFHRLDMGISLAVICNGPIAGL